MKCDFVSSTKLLRWALVYKLYEDYMWNKKSEGEVPVPKNSDS